MKKHLDHIVFPIRVKTPDYRRAPGRGKPIPDRVPREHGVRLQTEYHAAIDAAKEEVTAKLANVSKVKNGYYLEFEAATSFELNIDSLDVIGMELLSVREEDDKVIATVYVSESKVGVLDKKIREYILEPEDKINPDGSIGKKKPKNEPLLASIEHIRNAELLSLWKDPKEIFPKGDEEIWWELWVPNNSIKKFNTIARSLSLEINSSSVFIERTVFSAFGTAEKIDKVRLASGALAEIRRIKETPSYFMEMDNVEQTEWIDELTDRIISPENDDLSLCLLDTGVNNGHSLLQDFLQDVDMHAYNPKWSKKDMGKPFYHGTAMAGLSLFGDLQKILTHSETVQPLYVLESVRILSPNNDTDKSLYGAITDDAVSQVEIQAPLRKRSFCLAITATHYEGGQPSEWSASIDTICYNNGNESRLFCISSGNVREVTPEENYIDLMWQQLSGQFFKRHSEFAQTPPVTYNY